MMFQFLTSIEFRDFPAIFDYQRVNPCFNPIYLGGIQYLYVYTYIYVYNYICMYIYIYMYNMMYVLGCIGVSHSLGFFIFWTGKNMWEQTTAILWGDSRENHDEPGDNQI